jgi:hypothetical protein
MKFRIGTKVYTSVSLMKPSIRDYLKLAAETEALGKRWTQTEVFALEQEIGSLKSEEEAGKHPEMLFFVALILWATFAVQGEPDPFGKAVDVSLEDLQFLQDPADRKAAKNPTKARTGRAGSVRAVNSRAAKPRSPAKTSSRRSTRTS